mmetsp:Transcript_6364/g.10073  ORF Transcript_6364/g.10073 Transcript_6364/m.10073 type:complete len:192 (+) Transcript_6364:83-658(+)
MPHYMYTWLICAAFLLTTCFAGDVCVGHLSKDNEIKCEATKACSDCTIVCNECDLFNCGGTDSCRAFQDYTMLATDVSNDFLFECTGENSCRAGASDGGGVIEIFCAGKEIKGLKCGGSRSCQDAYILFIGDEDGDSCLIDKIECDGFEACKGTTFSFRNAEWNEVVCGGKDACDGARCDDLSSSGCPNFN